MLPVSLTGRQGPATNDWPPYVIQARVLTQSEGQGMKLPGSDHPEDWSGPHLLQAVSGFLCRGDRHHADEGSLPRSPSPLKRFLPQLTSTALLLATALPGAAWAGATFNQTLKLQGISFHSDLSPINLQEPVCSPRDKRHNAEYLLMGEIPWPLAVRCCRWCSAMMKFNNY
jgi:hypothetical protein